jgi:hypothetical protein
VRPEPSMNINEIRDRTEQKLSPVQPQARGVRVWQTLNPIPTAVLDPAGLTSLDRPGR